jgi:hypothetical protein
MSNLQELQNIYVMQGKDAARDYIESLTEDEKAALTANYLENLATEGLMWQMITNALAPIVETAVNAIKQWHADNYEAIAEIIKATDGAEDDHQL